MTPCPQQILPQVNKCRDTSSLFQEGSQAAARFSRCCRTTAWAPRSQPWPQRIPRPLTFFSVISQTTSGFSLTRHHANKYTRWIPIQPKQCSGVNQEVRELCQRSTAATPPHTLFHTLTPLHVRLPCQLSFEQKVLQFKTHSSNLVALFYIAWEIKVEGK